METLLLFYKIYLAIEILIVLAAIVILIKWELTWKEEPAQEFKISFKTSAWLSEDFEENYLPKNINS